MKRYPDGWGEAAPLTGLLYCADCGGKMYVHRTNNGKRISQYTCSQYSKVPVGVLCATQHRINESAVLTLVSDMLRATEYSRNDRAEFIKAVQETQAEQQASDINRKRKRLAAAQKRAGELEKLICKIYEDNVLGKLPDRKICRSGRTVRKEQGIPSGEILPNWKRQSPDMSRAGNQRRNLSPLLDKYENFDNLTTTMLNEFVEKILVHERDRKGSIETTQEVEIYFNFVGRYIPPHFGEMNLTPEELEALRKKEERKDKLHQAYLRRKANGTQKRYEDKIKAKKKAEIEAKKAAYPCQGYGKRRVYPASSLPKKEPKKHQSSQRRYVGGLA